MTFDDYLNSLSQLSNPFDPTAPTAESEEIRTIAGGLCTLASIDRPSLSEFIAQTPDAVPVLGLAVGLTREKLKNVLKHHLGSAGWTVLARQRPMDLVEMLDENYEVVRLIAEQRTRNYDFGDVLVARAGTRRTAEVLKPFNSHKSLWLLYLYAQSKKMRDPIYSRPPLLTRS